MQHHYTEPSVDFDWDAVYNHEDSGSLQQKQLSVECIEEMRHLLLFLSGYIFLPHVQGGKRSDREKLIAVKSLSAFVYLLNSHLGSKYITDVLRLSGLNVTPRNFRHHMQVFGRYLNDNEISDSAIKKLAVTEKGKQ